MTAAELKTLRESLGLSAQWVAENIANCQLRSYQFWEAGERAVPEDVAEQLEELDERFEDLVEGAVSKAEESNANEVALIRYKTDEDLWQASPSMKPLPARAHAALIARTKRDLEALGFDTKIVYFDLLKYQEFLKGRKDTPARRSEWACDEA